VSASGPIEEDAFAFDGRGQGADDLAFTVELLAGADDDVLGHTDAVEGTKGGLVAIGRRTRFRV